MDTEFVRELFARFGPVSVNRMFGGAGIWSGGLMLAIAFDGVIYLRVDEASIADFEREGSKPFVYPRATTPGKIGRPSRAFWRLPERLYDDPDELAVWAQRSLAIAERKKLKPRAKANKQAKRPQAKRTKQKAGRARRG
jgi:DNA transformation protein and related proteins